MISIKPYKSHRVMSCYWTGCFVLGLVYLFAMWDGSGSAAFIVSQVFMGALGMCREYYLSRHGFERN